MNKVKDYFGEKYLSKEENIKLDFICAEPEGYEKNSPSASWDLTINTGIKDAQGYVDALIIRVSAKQYPSFLYRKHGENNKVEFSFVQIPTGMSEDEARSLISKYAVEIEDALDEFENED